MKDPNMSQKISDVDLMNATGQEFRRRENIELQCHFIDNKTEMVFDNDDTDIEIMDQNVMATVMELRTARMDHLKIEQSKRVLEVIKAEYVEFYLK